MIWSGDVICKIRAGLMLFIGGFGGLPVARNITVRGHSAREYLLG